VVLRARQFLGCRIDVTKDNLGDTWVGNDKGEAQLLFPHSRSIPLLSYHRPRLEKARQVAAEVLGAPYLHGQPEDSAWWAGLVERFSHTPEPFNWTLPTDRPYAQRRPVTAANYNSVAKILDLTLKELDLITPLPVEYFYEGPHVAKALAHCSATELKRRGASSVERVVHEDQLQALAKQRQVRKKSRKSADDKAEKNGTVRVVHLCSQ